MTTYFTYTSAASVVLKNDLFLHHWILMLWLLESWGLWALLNSYYGILPLVNCLHFFSGVEITVKVPFSSSFGSCWSGCEHPCLYSTVLSRQIQFF